MLSSLRRRGVREHGRPYTPRNIVVSFKTYSNAFTCFFRCNLASLVLLFKRLGINPRTFDFMTKPNSESFDQAFELLRNLGALDEADGLTLDGQMLAEFPLDPQQAKMLIQSARKYECSDQILSLVAMLSSPRVFVRPQARKTKAILCHARFASSSGDHLALINVFEAFQSRLSSLLPSTSSNPFQTPNKEEKDGVQIISSVISP